jgi:carboxylate-amine ligase
LLQFTTSKPFTLGIELEIQIINRVGKDLSGLANNILQQLKNKPYHKLIKPEVTQSMLEINSSIHETPQTLLLELEQIKNHLIEQTKNLNVLFSGGGTHPFQMWHERELYPTEHYKKVKQKYGYLAKMYTVFGMHIHIGCAKPNDALYLTHAMAKYVPHFIALSASSPFCQGIDTEFDSCRSNVVNLFPVSGMPPFILDWAEFEDYLTKMKRLRLIGGVNNFYWDIRPKAEFGTIEIRVCDTPLSIEKTVQIAAFAQSLAHYLLEEKPFSLIDKYDLYGYNRFQASKLGFNAFLINPITFEEYSLLEDILSLYPKMEPYSKALNAHEFIAALIADAADKKNDAAWLRKLFSEGEDLKDIIYLASHLFSGKINYSTSHKEIQWEGA